jgi:hypothetical protein
LLLQIKRFSPGEWSPPVLGIQKVENVGNLVCPYSYDLGLADLRSAPAV